MENLSALPQGPLVRSVRGSFWGPDVVRLPPAAVVEEKRI